MTYRFDDFTVDPGTRRLLRGEEERHLSPKALELLLVLIEGRERAMSKTELQSRLWPSTYVVETNLASLVAEIRRALGDSADEPRHVRTMHRFGYWFVGQLRQDDAPRGKTPPSIRYWLVWESRQIALTEGDNIVGRAPDAAVWIYAPGVSRQHARISLEGGQATVEDLGSKNGTYLGGRRLTAPSLLADGDQIRLGSIVVTFRIPPSPASTDTLRES
jgi:DNA-binding winged helix-turn-helix (wHTH) protein